MYTCIVLFCCTACFERTRTILDRSSSSKNQVKNNKSKQKVDSTINISRFVAAFFFTYNFAGNLCLTRPSLARYVHISRGREKGNRLNWEWERETAVVTTLYFPANSDSATKGFPWRCWYRGWTLEISQWPVYIYIYVMCVREYLCVHVYYCGTTIVDGKMSGVGGRRRRAVTVADRKPVTKGSRGKLYCRRQWRRWWWWCSRARRCII